MKKTYIFICVLTGVLSLFLLLRWIDDLYYLPPIVKSFYKIYEDFIYFGYFAEWGIIVSFPLFLMLLGKILMKHIDLKKLIPLQIILSIPISLLVPPIPVTGMLLIFIICVAQFISVRKQKDYLYPLVLMVFCILLVLLAFSSGDGFTLAFIIVGSIILAILLVIWTMIEAASEKKASIKEAKLEAPAHTNSKTQTRIYVFICVLAILLVGLNALFLSIKWNVEFPLLIVFLAWTWLSPFFLMLLGRMIMKRIELKALVPLQMILGIPLILWVPPSPPPTGILLIFMICMAQFVSIRKQKDYLYPFVLIGFSVLLFFIGWYWNGKGYNFEFGILAEYGAIILGILLIIWIILEKKLEAAKQADNPSDEIKC